MHNRIEIGEQFRDRARNLAADLHGGHRLQRSGSRYRIADGAPLDFRSNVFFGCGAALPQEISSYTTNEDDANRRHNNLFSAKPQFHVFLFISFYLSGDQSLYLPAPGILHPQPLGLGGDERRNISTTASPDLIESPRYDRLCSGS